MLADDGSPLPDGTALTVQAEPTDGPGWPDDAAYPTVGTGTVENGVADIVLDLAGIQASSLFEGGEPDDTITLDVETVDGDGNLYPAFTLPEYFGTDASGQETTASVEQTIEAGDASDPATYQMTQSDQDMLQADNTVNADSIRCDSDCIRASAEPDVQTDWPPGCGTQASQADYPCAPSDYLVNAVQNEDECEAFSVKGVDHDLLAVPDGFWHFFGNAIHKDIPIGWVNSFAWVDKHDFTYKKHAQTDLTKALGVSLDAGPLMVDGSGSDDVGKYHDETKKVSMPPPYLADPLTDAIGFRPQVESDCQEYEWGELRYGSLYIGKYSALAWSLTNAYSCAPECGPFHLLAHLRVQATMTPVDAADAPVPDGEDAKPLIGPSWQDCSAGRQTVTAPDQLTKLDDGVNSECDHIYSTGFPPVTTITRATGESDTSTYSGDVGLGATYQFVTLSAKFTMTSVSAWDNSEAEAVTSKGWGDVARNAGCMYGVSHNFDGKGAHGTGDTPPAIAYSGPVIPVTPASGPTVYYCGPAYGWDDSPQKIVVP
jgi:hypothetical protein